MSKVKLFESENLEKGGLNVWMQPGSLPAIIEVGGETIEIYIDKVTNYFVKVRIKGDPEKVDIATPKTLFTSLDPKNCEIPSDD